MGVLQPLVAAFSCGGFLILGSRRNSGFILGVHPNSRWMVPMGSCRMELWMRTWPKPASSWQSSTSRRMRRTLTTPRISLCTPAGDNSRGQQGKLDLGTAPCAALRVLGQIWSCTFGTFGQLWAPWGINPRLSHPRWREVWKYFWLTREIWLLFVASPNTEVPQFLLPLIFRACIWVFL